MNPIEMLRASGLNPIVIDEDLDSALSELLALKTELLALKTDTPRRETNIELVTRLMDYCPTGALAQPFIMHAIEMYCQLVAETDTAQMSNGLFSGEVWKETGAWLQGELNKHYSKG